MDKMKKDKNKRDKKAALEKLKFEKIRKENEEIESYEHTINERKKLLFDPKLDLHKIVIADISFAYANEPLIKLLESRGAAIKAFDWSKVKDYDQ